MARQRKYNQLKLKFFWLDGGNEGVEEKKFPQKNVCQKSEMSIFGFFDFPIFLLDLASIYLVLSVVNIDGLVTILLVLLMVVPNPGLFSALFIAKLFTIAITAAAFAFNWSSQV